MSKDAEQTPPPEVRYIEIDADLAGQRLDNFLITRLKGVPRSVIYRIVRKGEVRVNKRRASVSQRLQAGDQLRIPPLRQAAVHTPAVSGRLERVQALAARILYEDERLLVLNKPAQMAVHGGSGVEYGVIEAMRALRSDCRYLELVHRLDRGTSGVLVMAKKRSALRFVQAQFRERSTRKHYLTLVRGQWPLQLQRIDAPLLRARNTQDEVFVRVSSQGREALTEVDITGRWREATLLRMTPHTGRTHQIRVHCRHGGCPIAGDDRYGDDAFNTRMQALGLTRLFLHAEQLHLQHPDGRAMHWQAPLDDDLQAVLQQLTPLGL